MLFGGLYVYIYINRERLKDTVLRVPDAGLLMPAILVAVKVRGVQKVRGIHQCIRIVRHTRIQMQSAWTGVARHRLSCYKDKK